MRMWLTLPADSQLETDTLTITVEDGEGAIVGAKVAIGDNEENTDEEGKASFDLEYGDYTATVTMNGYADAEKSIAFRNNHKNFTITLTAISDEDNGGD